jgi:hypothetical protein
VFAVLEFLDYLWIARIVIIFGGGSAAYSLSRLSEGARLRRLEDKVDLILKHLGLEYQPGSGLSAEVRALADDPRQKINAIKLHREQTGVGLREAKQAIEDYMAGRH